MTIEQIEADAAERARAIRERRARRDLFAARAMDRFLQLDGTPLPNDRTMAIIAHQAHDMADIMLSESDRREEDDDA